MKDNFFILQNIFLKNWKIKQKMIKNVSHIFVEFLLKKVNRRALLSFVTLFKLAERCFVNWKSYLTWTNQCVIKSRCPMIHDFDYYFVIVINNIANIIILILWYYVKSCAFLYAKCHLKSKMKPKPVLKQSLKHRSYESACSLFFHNNNNRK